MAAGRTHWFLHPMAMGETMGYCARLAQNNKRGQYEPAGRAARNVHVALMGDPTLRLHVVAPPLNFQAKKDGRSVVLSWESSPDQVLGYVVYRSASPMGPYTRLNKRLLTAASFTHKSVPAGAQSYMLRAVALQISPSGSYINASTGIFAAVEPNAED